jgi:hypothetical protein
VDGVNWTSSAALQFRAITFGNNLFVGLGSGIWTSTAGDVWTRQNSDDFSTIAFANGSFTAVGDTVVVSQDGTNWTTTGSTKTYGIPGLAARGIAGGDQGFVAVGYDNFSVGFSTSADRTNWTARGRWDWDGPHLLRIIFVDGVYVAVGVNGTIVQSIRPSSRAVPLLADGFLGTNGFELNAIAQPAYSYRVQKSSSLSPVSWADVFTFTNAQAVTHFVDSAATNAPTGFYRIISP